MPQPWALDAGRDRLLGMLTYSLLATLGLAYFGISGEWVGKLLWPAVALHALLTLFLIVMCAKHRTFFLSVTSVCSCSNRSSQPLFAVVNIFLLLSAVS